MGSRGGSYSPQSGQAPRPAPCPMGPGSRQRLYTTTQVSGKNSSRTGGFRRRFKPPVSQNAKPNRPANVILAGGLDFYSGADDQLAPTTVSTFFVGLYTRQRWVILSRFDVFHIMLGPARLKEFVDSDLKRQL